VEMGARRAAINKKASSQVKKSSTNAVIPFAPIFIAIAKGAKKIIEATMYLKVEVSITGPKAAHRIGITKRKKVAIRFFMLIFYHCIIMKRNFYLTLSLLGERLST